jgi:hypothetical protein
VLLSVLWLFESEHIESVMPLVKNDVHCFLKLHSHAAVGKFRQLCGIVKRSAVIEHDNPPTGCQRYVHPMQQLQKLARRKVVDNL